MTQVFGVTGRMASGKSTAIENLMRRFAKDGASLTLISIDDIRRDIMNAHPSYAALRRDVARHFGVQTQGTQHTLPRAELAAAVFSTSEGPCTFWRMAGRAIIAEARAKIAAAPGYAALEWVRLAEDGFSPLLTDNVLIVTCSDRVQAARLHNTDLPPVQIPARLSRQPDTAALCAQWKTPWVFDTSDSPGPEAYDALYRRIRHDLGRKAA